MHIIEHTCTHKQILVYMLKPTNCIFTCRLMINFTKNESDPEWRGYIYAVLLFLTAVVQSLFLHQYFHRCFTIGMRIRTAIIAAVYNKVEFSVIL